MIRYYTTPQANVSLCANSVIRVIRVICAARRTFASIATIDMFVEFVR